MMKLPIERTLRALAHERGMTLAAVADVAGISRATVYRIFRETQRPRVDTLEKLARALGADFLFTAEGNYLLRKGNGVHHMNALLNVCADLRDDALFRVLSYARYERDAQ